MAYQRLEGEAEQAGTDRTADDDQVAGRASARLLLIVTFLHDEGLLFSAV